MPSTRRFSTIAAMLIAVTTIAGCGLSRSDEDSSTREQTPSAPTTTLAPAAPGKYAGVEDDFCEELALADVLAAHRATKDPDRTPGSVWSDPSRGLGDGRPLGTDTSARCELSGEHPVTSIQGGLALTIYADPSRAGPRYDNNWRHARAIEVKHLDGGWWERAVYTEVDMGTHFLLLYNVHDDNLYLSIDLATGRQADHDEARELFHDIAADVLDHTVTHLPLREQ